MKKKKLGEILRERGQISSADLSKAIEAQPGKLVHLGELLLERKLVSKPDLASALEEITRVPYVDCRKLHIDEDVLKLLPRAMAKRCCGLPLQVQGTTKLLTVLAEPQNLQIVDELRFSTGMEIVPRLAFRDDIEAAIEKWYGPSEKVGKRNEKGALESDGSSSEDASIEFVSSGSLQRNQSAAQEMQIDLLQRCTPAVRLAASMIRTAADKHASDIHIEPQANDSVVRLRLDGLLRDYQRIPRSIQGSVVSRIKILCDMDIGDRHTPQEGRFLVKISGRKIELRVTTLPTQYGEKIVMRLLEADAVLQPYAALGLPTYIADALKRMLALPQGMILVTGPTGSGRSTTLYSSLSLLRKSSLNVITVEDPVEHVVPGLNQVQVNTKKGLTFASSLRSILRQDPNVIMIGEIGDKETAEIAAKAAETSHLVLSTLHTNDSISAVTRLLDLGLPAAAIASAVTGIVGQRLIRRLCGCHKVVPASPEFVSRLKTAGMSDPPEMQSIPVGCEICDLTGYQGRVGVYELLEFSEPVRSLIRSGARNEQIRVIARQNGMKLMQEYALDLVREGITTLEEALRIVPFESASSASCPSCESGVSAAFLFCPFCATPLSDSPAQKSRSRTLAGQGASKA